VRPDSVAVWPKVWPAQASRSWTCPPSWPLGRGCSTPAMPVRPTPSTLLPSQWSPSTIVGCTHLRAEGHSIVLRLLSERRDDLTEERTRTANRLHALLRDLIAGGAKRNLTAEQAAALLHTVRPVTAADEQRKALCRELVADLRRLDTALRRNGEDIAAAVAAHGTSVTQIHGIGPILAAKILGHTSAVERFPTRHHFASYCGTAPIEASSGEQRRHRLSRAGNRQLNRALHLVAVCQIRPAVRGGSTTSANSARPRPRRRHVGRSNAGCATPSTATSSEINKQLLDIQRRHICQAAFGVPAVVVMVAVRVR
jgi:hypothetical protein